MKTNDSSFDLVVEKKQERKKGYDSSEGITKRLLAKYEPSKVISIINAGKGRIREGRAA